jgi:hypothetical protein
MIGFMSINRGVRVSGAFLVLFSFLLFVLYALYSCDIDNRDQGGKGQTSITGTINVVGPGAINAPALE